MAKESLSKLFDRYYDQLKFSAKRSDETLRGYKETFKLFNRLMPTVTPDMLNADLMTLFFKKLDSRERQVGRNKVKTGLRPTTVATYRSKLNNFFVWLINNKIIDRNPFEGIPYPQINYDDKKYLEKEEVERIVSNTLLHSWPNNLVKTRNVAILLTLLCCGLRRGELVGLRVSDVDFKRNSLTVRKETSKSKITRVVPINSQLRNSLLDYIEQRQKQCYKTEYFFVSNNTDGQLTLDGLKHLVAKLNEISGVKFHLHQFRHTYGINLVARDVNLAKLKQLMGHKDIRMTSAYLRCIPLAEMRADAEHITLENLM